MRDERDGRGALGGRGGEDPVDAYLDGALRRDQLPDDVRRDEDALAEALALLDVSREPSPSVRSEVMGRIDALPRSRWNDFVDWCLRPRSVSVTPAAAGGFALAGVGLLALGVWTFGPTDPAGSSAVAPGSAAPPVVTASTAAADPGGRILTRFVFVAPDADRVTLTGDWLGWDPDRVELVRHGDSGIWTVEIPVPTGVHEYSFVVDDEDWRPDPLAGAQADDGFGRTNSILMVSRAEV